MELFLSFLYGICIGSFLGVVIQRLPLGKSITKGRSYCDSCKHSLSWHDLIPLFSYLSLRGRCRYCKKSIGIASIGYELLTGLGFVLCVLMTQFSLMHFSLTSLLSLLYAWYLFCVLEVVFFVDLRHYYIPDVVIFPAMVISLGYAFCYHFPTLLSYASSGAIAGAFFLFLYVITKRKGMGLGDVKFAVLMGLILGFPQIIVALYIAFLTGAVIATILIICRVLKLRGSIIPFGPFLVVGTFISYFWGNVLVQHVMELLVH